VRSYGSASVAATYSGPLPGTLCYDGSCQQAAPGYYTAPAEQVIRTWTRSYPQSCPAGYRGSITVTEQWQTVKYWTPSAGGLSSRGTLTFTSATRDEMVDRAVDWDCEPIEPPESPTSTQTTQTNTQTTQTNTQTTPDDPSKPSDPGPSGTNDTNDTGDTNTDEANWSDVNIDLGVIPSSSQTTHLSQRPPLPKRQVTLLPFLPPREGLW
jgi:hypothetical protein